MNIDLLQGLLLCETDVDGAIRRFCGDEALYVSCLNTFLQDTTVDELAESLEKRSWDDAFTAAHALKGLAGNMGFIPLFHAVGELVLLIRDGRIPDIDPSFLEVRSCYNDICGAIRTHGGTAI